MSLSLAASDPAAARRELISTWALAVGGLAVAKLLSLADPTGLLAGNLAGVAAFLFIALPDRRLRQRGEGWEAYGLPWWGVRDARTWRAWGRGAAQAVLICAVVFPAFFAVFVLYAKVLPHLPQALSRHVAPYALPADPAFRLPDRFALTVVNQLFVVALPEELFYRGWMQTTWAATAPGRRRRILGATVGAGFVATQALFALGHLVVLQVWRLGTFFPGLLFGWVRERTGSIPAAVFVHALSNLFIATLEASFYR